MFYTEQFAQALLYANKFSRANKGMFPYLFHQYGVKGEGGTGFYCPECDPKGERPYYQAANVEHLQNCEYLAFRRALAAAKQLKASPQAR